jgi:IclR family pca regulon transcriptional regulator
MPATNDADVDSFISGPDYVQSLERGLAVIRAFGSNTPTMTLSEVAIATGLSRAVVRRQLLTLAHLGYVRQDGRSFALTTQVLELGFSYLGSLGYPELARPAMEALSRTVNESCSMGVLEDGDVVYVQRVPVRKIMTVALGIGAHLPAWCTSMGRVLLAGLQDEALAAWLAAYPAHALTEHTCTDAAQLRARIERVRQDGYAYVEQELEHGLCSVAVPLRGPDGSVVAAINVGMAFRDDARQRALEQVLPALRATAAEIQREAGPRLPARFNAGARRTGTAPRQY